jgi:tripartite-type tricarboxylate transporter receptor subunit TctC
LASLFVPAQTPPDIVTRVHSEAAAVLQEPEVKARVLDLGFVPGGKSPSEFQKQVLSDQARWADLIKKAGIKPE